MPVSARPRRLSRVGAIPLLFLTVLGLVVGGLSAPAYAAATVSGVVADLDGTPIAGVNLEIGTRSASGDFVPLSPAKTAGPTAADGKFAFSTVADNASYIVRMTGPLATTTYYYNGPDAEVSSTVPPTANVAVATGDTSVALGTTKLPYRKITGTVKDAAGNPITGATVRTFAREGAAGSQTCSTVVPSTPAAPVAVNDQGVYAFSVPKDLTNVVLSFAANGFKGGLRKGDGTLDSSTSASTQCANAEVFATGTAVAVKNVTMAPVPGSISGKVTRGDSVRAPALEGVTVELLQANGNPFATPKTTETDDEGAYAFSEANGNAPAPGDYKISFSLDDYDTEYYNEKAVKADASPVTVSANGSLTNINATLVKTLTSEISGVVTTPSGVPISDVDVSLHVRTNASGGTGAVEYSPALSDTSGDDYIGTTTLGDGAFTLEGNLNQPYVVQFRSDAFQTVYFNGGGAGSTNPDTAQTITLTKTAGARANVSVALNSGVTFNGTVTDDQSTPAPLKDVDVTALYPVTQSNGGVVWTAAATVKTATDGTYRLVAPSQAGREYILSFDYPNRLTQYAPASGANTVFLASAAKKYPGANALQENVGTTKIVKSTAVTGKVTDVQGLPITGATVSAVTYSTAKGAWDPAESYAAPVTTGNDGVFVLPVKDAGRDKPFRLQVVKEGRAATFFPSAYTADEATNLVVAADTVSAAKNVTLPSASLLAGTVTNSDGTAYTGGGSVELWRQVAFTSQREAGGVNKSEWRRFATASLSSGSFSLSQTDLDTKSPVVASKQTGLPPGTYKIKALVAGNQEGFLPGLVGLDQAPGVALGAEQQLGQQKYSLPAQAEIRGTVSNLTGAPVPNEDVHAVYRYVENIRDGAPVLGPWREATPKAVTSSAGTYVVDLFSRTYRVGSLGDGEVFQPGFEPPRVANDRGYYTTDPAPTSEVLDANDVTLDGVDVTGIDFRLNVGAPINLQPPYVSGIAQEGETLRAQPGAWSASDATFAYNWQFSANGTTGWRQAASDTTDSFTLENDGRDLVIGQPCILVLVPVGCSANYRAYSYRVVVTATRPGANGGTAAPVESKATSVAVGALDTTVTENRQDPQITGKALVGETLTGSDGHWSEGGNFTYQWFADGQVVPGATTKTLVVPDTLITRQISFRVTHTQGTGNSQIIRTATSALTAPVGKGVLTNTSLPKISGDALVGKTLTADPGTWNDPSPTFAYQWLANSQPIAGATTNKLVLTEAENGKAIAVRVTASKAGNAYTPGTATSASTSPVGDDPTKVSNKTKPVVSGQTKVGETLSTTDGTWSNQPTSFTYQWLADGTAVTGATASTFVLTKDQRGKKMSVRVTASKSGLTSGTATSEETAAVAGGPLENKTKPTITGQTLEGATLTADPGTWEPETVTPVFTYQWVADGANIAGATSRTYTLTSAEVGKTVTVKVTASANGFDSGTATSAGVGPIDEPQGEITVTGGPSIAGSDTVGEMLSLNPGSVTPGDATITVQWFRDGTAITGATARTYRLVAADEDALITARVTYTKDDFVTLVKSTSAVGPVEPRAEEPDPVKPTLKTSKKVKGKKLVVKVRVFADSQDPVTGQVELTEGKKLYALKTLNNGKKKLVVKGLKKGYHSVKLTFLGNDLVKKKSKTLNFTIR